MFIYCQIGKSLRGFAETEEEKFDISMENLSFVQPL